MRLQGALLEHLMATTPKNRRAKRLQAIIQYFAHVSTGWRLRVNNLMAYYERDLATSAFLGAQSGMVPDLKRHPVVRGLQTAYSVTEESSGGT